MPGCRNMAIWLEGYKNILIQLLYNMEERSKNRKKNTAILRGCDFAGSHQLLDRFSVKEIA